MTGTKHLEFIGTLSAFFFVGWLAGMPRPHAVIRVEKPVPGKTELALLFPAVLPDHSAARPSKPKPTPKKR